MTDPNPEAALVQARLGAIRPFLFSVPAATPMLGQATALFETVSRVLGAKAGWLIEDVIAGGSGRGFAELMERRERGELSWDAMCPFPPPGGPAVRSRPAPILRKPHTMLAYGGYPCWAAQAHVYTIDLFNPANELMFPYVDQDRRLWALIPYPPGFKMPDPVWVELLKAVALALEVDYAFGGPWVAAAAMAYVFPDQFNRLDASTRLTGMTYPHMIVRTADLPRDAIKRLREGVAPNSVQKWYPTVCDEFGDGRYLFLSTAPEYGDENVHLGRAAARVIGRPYVTDVLVKPNRTKD